MTIQCHRLPSGELSFDVHQHFDDAMAPTSVLSYAIEPTGGRQARFFGRVAVRPLIDLSLYRQKAVVDWLEIRVCLRDMTQGRHVHDLVEKCAGVSVHAKPLPKSGTPTEDSSRDGAEEGRREDSRTSNTFTIRVQDPTKELVDQIVLILGDRWGSIAEPVVCGMEVSIDWYSRKSSADELHLITGVLQRHFVPYSLNPARAGARPRSVYGRFVGKDGKTRPYTRHLYDPSQHLYLSPVVNGTLYFDARDAPIFWKIMHKVSDQRTGNAHRALPIEEHRARIEVTFQEEPLLSLGIRTLDDLESFRFERLKRDFFGFSIPTVPGEVDASGNARPSQIGYRHLSIFQRSGAFQFMHWEKGYLDLGIKTAIQNGRRRSDARILKQRRLLKQDHLFMLAYDQLNRQAENALRSLKWGRR